MTVDLIGLLTTFSGDCVVNLLFQRRSIFDGADDHSTLSV